MAKKPTTISTSPDSKDQIKSKQKELTNLILEKYAGKLKNMRSIFITRKEIARLKTTQRLKELKNK